MAFHSMSNFWNSGLLTEDGITIGGSDENIYSHEYLFRCARCRYEQRMRK